MSETNKGFDLSRFDLNDEQLDSLRLEVGRLTPSQQELLTSQTREVKEELLRIVRPFIPTELMKKYQNIEGRIIFLSKYEFNRVISSWVGQEYQYHPKTFAITHHTGEFILMALPAEFSELVPIEKQLDSDFEAELIEISFVEFLAHEMVHLLQSPETPAIVYELAARWYARQVVASLTHAWLEERLENLRVEYFQQALERFGDKLHYYVFNPSRLSSTQRDEIFNYFREAKDMLFPKEMGL